MSCTYCEESPLRQSIYYNIENVKQRFIPTFYHSQIFGDDLRADTCNVRCTPTFHSTALRVDGYRSNPKNHPYDCGKAKKNNSVRDVVYRNQSRQKKQDQFYSSRGINYKNSSELWYDKAKRDMLDELNVCGRGNSRERKLIDLSSNPVFGAPFVEHCHQCEKQQELVRKQEFTTFGTKDEEVQANINIEQNVEQTKQEPIRPQYIQAHEKKSEVKTEKVKSPVKEIKNAKVGKHLSKTIPVSSRPTFTVVRKKPF